MNVPKLNKLLIIVSLVFTCLVSVAGYFGISFLSDDSLNLISANVSSVSEKFSSAIPYYTGLHFRPLWFLSIELTSSLSGLLGLSTDDALLFRIENLLLFITLAFVTAHLIHLTTGSVIRSAFAATAVLFFPNNVNNICWTIGMSDLLAGTFILLSIFFGLRYVKEISVMCMPVSILFFVLALLTKETSVITPFAFLALSLSQKSSIRKNLLRLFVVQIILLTLYFILRIVLLSNSPSELAGTFSDGTFAGRFVVLVQAGISMLIPFDYPTLIYQIRNFDFLYFAYLAILLITVIAVFWRLLKLRSINSVIIPLLIFCLAVTPNFLAGYFRPQLILIPFALTLTAVLMFIPAGFLNGKLFMKSLMILLFSSWVFISFLTVKQWVTASAESRLADNVLKNLTTYELKVALIVGLPGRLGQAHISEYVTGSYNLSRYGKLDVKIPINDIVHTSALDLNSLNSDLSVHKISDTETILSVTGESQYFQITGQREPAKSVDASEFLLMGQNEFGKSNRLKIVSNGSRPVYIYSNHELKKLEQWK